MIPVFNEGTMRYHDPESGRMVKSPTTSESTPVGSNLGASSIVAALRTEFKGLNAHLAFRFDSVIQAMQGTAAERRDELISSENTDVPPPVTPPETGGKSFMDTLRGLNPFQDGIGTKMSIFLLASGLALLAKFGDKLVKPLASLLEWFDKEGSILDKLKETKLWQGIIDSFEKITGEAGVIQSAAKKWEDSFADMKTTVEDIGEELKTLAESAQGLKDMAAGVVLSVQSFIAKFDTSGEGPRNQYSDGKLDAFELQLMADTIKTNIKDAIVGFTEDVFLGLKGFILSATLLGTTLSLLKNHPVIKGIFGGVARTGSVAAAAGIGAAGYAGIAGLLIYGVSTTWSNFTDSMKKSLEENDGEFVASDFFGRFFGGKDEGGWMNALSQAFKIGGTGALVGMSIGAIGGPVGILAGGFIGLGIGAVIGGLSGWFGKNKMEDFFDKIGTDVTNTVDTIVGFFQDVVSGVESAIDGDGFEEGYNKSQGANYERNKRKHDDAVKTLASYNSGENKMFNLLGPSMQAKKIKKQEEKIAKYKSLMQDAPQQKFNNLQAEINAELESIAEMEAEMASGNMMRGIDMFSDVSFSDLIQQSVRKIETLRAEQDEHRIKYNLSGEVISTQVEIDSKEKKAEQKRKIESIMDSFSRNFGVGYFPAPSGSTSINSTKQNFSTVSSNSLSVDDKSTSARLLSSGAYATLGLDFLKAQ